MTNITKNKITINSIINFIHEAMRNNYKIESYKICYDETYYSFNVSNSENHINFEIKVDGNVIIMSNNGGTLDLNFDLSNRDIIDLETLIEDVRDYREEVCLHLFNNFFSNVENKPASLDDLSDDD